MIKVNGRTVLQDRFLDNSLFPHIDVEANNHQMIEWNYENDAELFTLICVKKHIDRILRDPEVDLFMPYIPHARMDRVKDNADVFTLKYFCETINSLKFKQVVVRDAHSNVSLALLDNVIDLGADPFIKKYVYMWNPNILFFPDEGAMKRYKDSAPLPYAFGVKNRDWKTGQILGLDIMNADLVKGKDVLIIDDICSKGGTFYHSAKALKAAGANKIYLYVSHLEQSVLLGDLYKSNLIEAIGTTDTLAATWMKTVDFTKDTNKGCPIYMVNQKEV